MQNWSVKLNPKNWFVPKQFPTAEFKPAEVTVEVAPIVGNTTDEMRNQGEKHSRLWIHFLKGAITALEEELPHASSTRTLDIANEIQDKKKQIAIHEVLYPSSERDAAYVQEHVFAAKGNNP